MKQTAYVIAYDIGSNKRRNKVKKTLEKSNWKRIQYSVWIKRTTLPCLKKQVLVLDAIKHKDKNDSIICLHFAPKLLPLAYDNNRLNYYLSDDIEHIFI